MTKIESKSTQQKHLTIIIPVCSICLSLLLLFSSIDDKIRDLFQRFIPSVEENKNVLLVNIDDIAIENLGTFPWTRDIIANQIIALKEYGAKSIVLDLNYLDKSPLKVNNDYLNTNTKINDSFSDLQNSIDIIFDSIDDGSIRKNKYLEAKTQLGNIATFTENIVNSSIDEIILDTDKYFSFALAFTNNTNLAITMTSDTVSQKIENDFYSLKNVTVKNDSITPEFSGIQWPISELLLSCSSVGFINSESDKDGYRRRIHLIAKNDGKYYGQLIFVPILNFFGNPEIIISNSSIVLKNAKISNSKYKDIKIPREKDGSVLIHWPKKTFNDYYSISSWEIQKSISLENILVSNLQLMDENGFFDYQEDSSVLDYYFEAKNSIDSFSEYVNKRNIFFDKMKNFIYGEREKNILASLEDDIELTSYIEELFSVVRKQFTELLEIRANNEKKIKDSICIIGNTATSNTDSGLTIYEQDAPNVGIHYACANMIFDENFISDTAFIVQFVFAIVLVFAFSLLNKKTDKSKLIIFGIAFILISILVPLLVFVIFRKYIGVSFPLLSIFLTFIFFTIYNFFATLQEKSFIHSAFSHYLSSEVIKQIIADPSKLSLGGEKRELTAIFTDIRGFSTISEKLDPVQLVNLLNKYLTTMCNIILNNKGTIDKFEGDAIIAFFGAPISIENHAYYACLSAIQMKKAEIEFNKEILNAGESPSEVFTRIGINTGDMVVGNMGTKNKMDYTIMGNAVNLASRLEGINKQYFTKGIIVSEQTWTKTNNSFCGRKLDRVRVVGINTPVRLYEVFDEIQNVSEEQKQFVRDWEIAISLYENKKFTEAKNSFESLYKFDPDDNTAKLYLDRCIKYCKEAPGEAWDAVVNMSQK